MIEIRAYKVPMDMFSLGHSNQFTDNEQTMITTGNQVCSMAQKKPASKWSQLVEVGEMTKSQRRNKDSALQKK